MEGFIMAQRFGAGERAGVKGLSVGFRFHIVKQGR